VKERDHSEGLDVNGRTILKRILKRGGCGVDLTDTGLGPVAVGFCEQGDEPFGSIKGGQFLDQLSD
jgi:hypothetical protein